MHRMARGLGLALLIATLSVTPAGAATLTPIGAFDKPIFITSDPEDPDRLLVVERDGRVAEIDGEGAVPKLHADLTGFVACCAGERGLLSIAPAADFHTSGLFYAAYTGEPTAGGDEGDIHVDAFVADDAGGVVRTPILRVPHGQQAEHNGGQIQFGPDGFLYVSTGDGGVGGDPFETGQSLSSLLGKILRIDPHPGSSPAYSIPPGNPFAGATAGADEIWAFGLRNPWRFSFDSLTGDMLVGDVGQGLREEVDLAASPSTGVVGGAGANYGWSCREGFLPYTDSTPTANCVGVSGFTDPIFDYPHANPGGGAAYGCSITGGYVVRDPSLGDLYGRYVYADFCVGQIRSLALPTGTAPAVDRSEGLTAASPFSFGEDSCGRLYVASGSTVYRFDGAVPADCPDPPVEEPPTEEEPIETPPADRPPETAPQPLVDAPAPSAFRRLTIRLADRFRRHFAIEARAFPCAVPIHAPVQLRRNGTPLSTRELGPGCRVTFFRRNSEAPAAFRAMLRPRQSPHVFRSPALWVGRRPAA